MPDAKYTGNPTGSGNPPGEHRKAYLNDTGMGAAHFNNKSYRGNMHVGINEAATVVGNQPQQEGTENIEVQSNK